MYTKDKQYTLLYYCIPYKTLIIYRSEPSLSNRSRELVDAAPGDVLRKLSDPLGSDSEFLESMEYL